MHGLRRTVVAFLTLLAAPVIAGAQAAPDTLIIAAGGDFSIPLPGMSRPVEAQRISDLLFLRLGRYAGTSYGDKAAVPELARSWKRLDSTTIAFELDPRAKWHDGTPVTADDVLFSFERARDPKRAAQLAPLLNGISSVSRDADGRIVVKFTRPYSEQLYDATYHVHILPKHLVASIPADSLMASAYARAPVGNGPYRWSRAIPGQLTELAAVPDFFLGKPRVDRVVWRFVGSHEARLNELLSGGADMMEDFLPPTTNLARLAERSDLRLAQFPSQTIAYLLLNQRNPRDTTGPHPILSRPAVREALALGLDQQTMIRGLMGKYAEPISGPTPGAAWYRTLAPPPIKFDPKRAQAILFQDGWRDVDGDGILERDGQPLRLGIMMPMSSTVRVQLAQVVEQQWRAIGVDVDVQPVEGTVFRASRLGGRFDITVESYSIDPSPWGLVDLFGCTGANNLARYCNAAADSLLSRAHWSQENPNADLRRYFSMLVADHPAIFLYGRDFALPIPKQYRNPDFHPESPYLMVWTWNRSGR